MKTLLLADRNLFLYSFIPALPLSAALRRPPYMAALQIWPNDCA